MGDDLMAEEIEIHPFRARPPLRTAEQFAIKSAGFGKIAHGKSQMKARTFGHDPFLEIRQSLNNP
jgi:hypothetical protein